MRELRKREKDYNDSHCSYCCTRSIGCNQGKQRREHGGGSTLLPQTIGSTTGGMILFTAADYGRQPACMLFANPIDSIGAAGVLWADIWTEAKMPTIDSLGEEFLSYVKTGMTVNIRDGGIVEVDD